MTTMHRRTLAAVSLMMMVACRQDLSQPGGPDYTLTISGNLSPTSIGVTANEAAVFLDGIEIGRATCDVLCVQLSLNVTASGIRGVHTLDVQLVRQECNLMPCDSKQNYGFGGTVNVSGAGAEQIPLPHQSLGMNQGDLISYRIYVNP